LIRQGIQDVFDQFAQLIIDPWLVRVDEAEVVLVVCEIDGDEEVALLRDAFPVAVHQGAAVPDLVEIPVGVAFLDQDGVAVPVGVVGMTLPGVVLDEAFDEVLTLAYAGSVGDRRCRNWRMANKSGRKSSWLDPEMAVTAIEPGNSQIESELLHLNGCEKLGSISFFRR
jgi:hypothetical protein